MKRDKITIKGRTYLVGFSFEGIKLFEELTNKSIVHCITTWDHLTYFYCVLKSLNETFTYDFKTFQEIMDNTPEILAQFKESTNLEPEPEDEPEDKKKMEIRQIFGLWMLFLLLSVLPVLLPIISIIACLYLSLWLLVRLIGKIGKSRGCRS